MTQPYPFTYTADTGTRKRLPQSGFVQVGLGGSAVHSIAALSRDFSEARFWTADCRGRCQQRGPIGLRSVNASASGEAASYPRRQTPSP
jgi:hypothetical protein